jgi:hypothetical protein
VISYVNRQHTNLRKLLQEGHSGLVAALTGLVEQKNEDRQAIMDAADGGDIRDTLKRDLVWESNELYAERQTFDSLLEPGGWKRSKSLEFASEFHLLPIPTYYESTLVTEKSLSGSCSSTPYTHLLIGQLIGSGRDIRTTIIRKRHVHD